MGSRKPPQGKRETGLGCICPGYALDIPWRYREARLLCGAGILTYEPAVMLAPYASHGTKPVVVMVHGPWPSHRR